MVRVESSVEIAAPIERVFAFLANPKNYEKIFAESEVKVEMLSKDPIGIGTSYCISLVLGGRKVDFHTHEYVEFEENHRFTDREIKGSLKREDMTFVRARVIYELEVRGVKKSRKVTPSIKVR